MIQLTNVTKSYGTGGAVLALNNITLQIGAGRAGGGDGAVGLREVDASEPGLRAG